jgi:hypothetical protein
MNWKLIFGLSLFGLAMGIATVYWVPPKIEPCLWLPIFLICAWLIAKNATGKYFLHGFLVSLVNCVWITGAHIILSAEYLAHHPQETQQYAKLNAQMGLSVARAMLLVGPVIGIIFGLILGLLAVAAARLLAVLDRQ